MFAVISTPHYLLNILTNPEVADHLIPNIKKFDVVYFMRRDLKGGRPAEADDNEVTKIQLLCRKGKIGEIMNYLKEYYIKRYDVVCYYEEVNVPM